MVAHQSRSKITPQFLQGPAGVYQQIYSEYLDRIVLNIVGVGTSRRGCFTKAT